FTGNIWKRDAYLDGEAGITIEFGVRIPDLHTQAQNDTFTLQYVGSHGSFGIYLSPYCVKVGRLRPPEESDRHACLHSEGNYVVRALDTTSLRVYRVTVLFRSLDVTLYVDGQPEAFLVGQGQALPFVRTVAPFATPEVGNTEYEHPYVLIGD